MLKDIQKIIVEHPKTSANLTFWQKVKLLLGKDVILYIETSFTSVNGVLTIHSKPILGGPEDLPISEHPPGHR